MNKGKWTLAMSVSRKQWNTTKSDNHCLVTARVSLPINFMRYLREFKYNPIVHLGTKPSNSLKWTRAGMTGNSGTLGWAYLGSCVQTVIPKTRKDLLRTMFTHQGSRAGGALMEAIWMKPYVCGGWGIPPRRMDFNQQHICITITFTCWMNWKAVHNCRGDWCREGSSWKTSFLPCQMHWVHMLKQRFPFHGKICF